MPLSSTGATSATGSILRRLVGAERAGGTDPRSSATPEGPHPVEAELAESLDTVLRIVGRLAASHDRAELVRMIVDETKDALRADATTFRLMREERLEIAAWAGLPDVAARDMPALGRDEGPIGEVIRARHVMAWPDVHA
ncbi:MAG TPA: hypothetical protein VF119_01475, partial [Candidatus Limnocylindrales bacterium]